jgi:hypothetical protein
MLSNLTIESLADGGLMNGCLFLKRLIYSTASLRSIHTFHGESTAHLATENEKDKKRRRNKSSFEGV